MEYITKFTQSNLYRKKIHDLIPGGAHTYSKGDDQYPELSPAAIKCGKGAWVWDIDDNKYLDCGMGLTSVSLGHAYEPVLERVREELSRGVNFQRPSQIEMEMAETFLPLVPNHQMIKYAKNGSTATTAAVKLARGFTGRTLIALPFDHPFYSYDDWFIGTRPCNLGVPEQITSLTVGFDSNNLDTLEALFKKHPGQIAAVISEPQKNPKIAKEYMQRQQDLARNNGALYILDEMITGFKTHLPGSFMKYGIDPDLATWGKGIANGFSFCALTGKKKVMEIGGINRPGQEKLFLISSTHGGETHAIAAGLATIAEFKKHNVIEHNQKVGQELIDKCKAVTTKKGLSSFVEVDGYNWMVVFKFHAKEEKGSMGFYTLAQQEMIKRGVLFPGVLAPSFSHGAKEIDHFVEAYGEMLDVYAKALESGYQKFLVGPESKAVFRKYL